VSLFFPKKQEETIKPICNSFTMFFCCVWTNLGVIKRLCHLEIFLSLSYTGFSVFLIPLWRQMWNMKNLRSSFIYRLSHSPSDSLSLETQHTDD
jgi:hypothetical protein